MKTNKKTIIITWLATFFALFCMTGLFYGVLIHDYFFRQAASINISPETQHRVGYLVLVVAITTSALVYFILHELPKKNPTTFAILAGTIISVITNASWSLMNSDLVADFPLSLLLVDNLLHAIQGAIAGLIFILVYQWTSKRFGK